MTAINTSSVMALRTAIIAENDALRKAAAAQSASQTTSVKPQPEFGAALQDALQQTNALQVQAGAVTEAYTTGQTNDIAAVMLAKQKASLGFEATLQVRNKLLSAYKDIMSMPV